MKTFPTRLRIVALLTSLLGTTPAWAQDMLMARSKQSFPEAMLTLQTTIQDHGYKLSRVQRVDIGLTKSGFQTDKYRVVFFGKPKEIASLSRKYPKLIPYLPLKVTVFAEESETLVVAASPAYLASLYQAPDLTQVLNQWDVDLHSILDAVRRAE
jgi:uncharacterized protein (DUF302 family)